MYAYTSNEANVEDGQQKQAENERRHGRGNESGQPEAPVKWPAGAPAGHGRVHATIGPDDTVYGLMPDAPEEPLIVGLRRLYSWQPARAGLPPRSSSRT